MSFKKGFTSSHNSSGKGRKSTSSESAASEPSCKLVMVGDSGVGKSCLLEKLLDLSSTNAFISTIGVDVRTHVIKMSNGQDIKLQVCILDIS